MQILLFNDNCWICYFYFYFTSEVARLFPSTAEGDEELNDEFFQISSRHGETVFYRSFFLIKPSGCLEAPASCLFYFFFSCEPWHLPSRVAKPPTFVCGSGFDQVGSARQVGSAPGKKGGSDSSEFVFLCPICL